VPENAAFGEDAARWLAAFAPNRLTLAVDPSGAVDAYAQAARLRAAGHSFDIALLWPDRRTHVAIAIAGQSVSECMEYDKRRFALEAIGRGEGEVRGHKIETLLAVDIATMAAMRDLPMLAERILVRSWAEWRRITFEMGFMYSNVEVVERIDTTIPDDVERVASDRSILVWAPFTPPAKLSIIATALRELHRPVKYVCADGSFPNVEIENVALEDAAPVLGRAAAIVVADVDDPAPARTLARLGIPLCVAVTSGAGDYVAGARVFQPWRRQSVLMAVLETLGAPPPHARRRISAVTPQQWPAAVTSSPLVSVVVRTYDKPRRFLERALRSIEQQTYPNIETIVVNDAGPDVTELVGSFPNAQLITQPRNEYRLVTNTGMKRAKGTYVGRLDDDDALFPGHVATLVDALERSRGAFAYCDALVAYVTGEPPATVGYLVIEKEPVEVSKMLVVNHIVAPLLRSLIRREVLERAGWFSEAIYGADDYELLLRLLRDYDFLHVDRVTAMYTQFEDGSNLSSRGGTEIDDYRLIQTLHPVGERPHVIAARSLLMRELERGARNRVRRPPWRFPQPVPLPGYEIEEPRRLTT
jgi:hypothetical protein